MNSEASIPPRSPEAERWSRIKAAFVRVLDSPPSKRSTLVAEICGGDADLLDEVNSLLASE